MLVLISSVFLIILTGAAYQYFKNSVDTQIWTADRIQAKLSAEAALNLATHMVVAGASLPQPGAPIPVLGTPTTHYSLPGDLGSAYVTVQAMPGNEQEITANAFTLHCIAWPPGTAIDSYGLRATVMPTNLARFSVFMDDPTVDGYYDDGYRFDGPFYANGPIRVYSESQTHENDVFFYSLSLTSDYYEYGTSSGTAVTTPAYGKLQMRPYDRLSMGAPYFELGVEPIPFGPTELNWQGIRSAAISGGLYLTDSDVPDRARLALKGDTLMIQADTSAAVVSYYLGGMDNPVVWIQNGPGNSFYLRGHQFVGLNMPLTIGAEGTFLMSGPLYYDNPDPQDPDNECLLGLLTPWGDMLIADEDSLENLGWDGESFKVTTDDGFTYSAVLVALDGVLEAEIYTEPDPQVEFKIIGGYMVQNEGFTGTGGPKPLGYTIGVYFDPRLLTMHPPFFPTTANWKTIMWEEVPDMWLDDVRLGYLYY